jgi:hypothetical protein
MKNKYDINFFTLIVFILVTIGWLIHINEYSINLPFYDSWDFNRPIFNSDSLLSAFEYQHGPHRQGLGGLIQYLILTVSNFNFQYIAYTGILGIYSGALIIIGAIKKLEINTSNLSIFIFVILTSIISQEAVTMNPNLSHGSLPFLLLSIIIYLHISDCQNNWKNGSIPVVVILLSYTGFGFIFSGVYLSAIIFYFIYSRSIQKNFVSLIFTIAICLLFFIGYKSNPSIDCYKPINFANIPEYINFTIYCLSRPIIIVDLIYKVNITVSLIIGWIYILLIIMILVALIRNYKKTPELYSLLIALILFSLIFSFLTAVGRSCGGNEAAFGGRYYLYVTPAFLALIIYLTHIKSGVFNTTNLYIFTVLLISLNLLWEKNNHIDILSYYQVKKNWIQCMKKSKNVTECTRANVIYPIPNGINETSSIFLDRNNR